MGTHADDDDGFRVSDLEAFDLERATGRAWSRFQARLGVHLAEMAEDDTLVIGVESAREDETAPYVQLLATGDELYLEASSNEHLTGPHRLSAGAEATLAELGLEPPTGTPEEVAASDGTANHALTVPRADADRLAVTAVRILRRVFAVPHPAFLEAEGLFDEPLTSAAGELDEGLVPVVPRNRAHLLELVDEALTPVFGHVPEHDDDGDIPVVTGSALVFVRVLEQTPAIELFTVVVDGIEHLDRAAFEVNVLNRDARFLQYVLVEDRVLAYLHIPAYPFVPHHLRGLLAMMSKHIDDVDDDLAARVGGRRGTDLGPVDPEDELDHSDDDAHPGGYDPEDHECELGPRPLHPVELTIMQIEAEEPGSVTPELAASLCEHDRELALALLAGLATAEAEVRERQDLALLAGEAVEVQETDEELGTIARLTSLLRRALRVMAEADMAERRRGAGKGARYRRSSRREDPPSLFDVD